MAVIREQRCGSPGHAGEMEELNLAVHEATELVGCVWCMQARACAGITKKTAVLAKG